VRDGGFAKDPPPSGEQTLAEDCERGQALHRRAFARRLRELEEGREGDREGRKQDRGGRQ
jgi:hypothetical protein